MKHLKSPIKWLISSVLSIQIAVLRAVLLIALAVPLAHASTPAELIEQAYQLRDGSITEFVEALGQLDRRQNELSSEQREHLAYLHAVEAFLKGNREGSLEMLNQLIGGADDLSVQLSSIATGANIYSLSGDMEKAFTVALEVNDKKYIDTAPEVHTRSILTIAYIYTKAGLFAEADKTIALIDFHNSSLKNRCIGLGLRVEIDFYLGRLGLDQYSQERSECLSNGELLTGYSAEAYGIRNRLELNDVDGALKLLLSHLERVKATNYNNLISFWYAMLSNAYGIAQNPDQAISYGIRALELSNNSFIETPILAHESLGYAYYLAGDLDKVRYHMLQRDRLFNEKIDMQRASAIAYHTVKLRNEQQEHQLAYLQEQVERLSTERKLANSEKENLALYALLITFSLAGGLGWTYRTRRINATLQRLVKHDALTGVLTRGYATQAMARVLKEQGVLAREASFILVDLDYFKQINDQFGHQAGDWALKQVSRQLSHIARKGDLVGRLGGEEFGILLPSCDLKSANEIAQRIREAFEQIRSEQHPQLEISGSFGVASTRTFGFDFDLLFAAADKALYSAKDDGRNRVVEAALVDA